MSALTNLFSSMANKIRSKVGGSDTYTPTEMVDAIDDVYDAGYADATTPITPSNASPAGMTANVGYKPTANGYAIESYNNVTPSNSSPVALTSGDIDKMGGNGYAIQSYDSVTPSSTPESVASGDIVKIGGSGVIMDVAPTSITPSDSNPVALTANSPVKPTTSGYAIESNPTSVTPDNASPVALTSGEMAKIGGAGYAIQSYDSITPASQYTSVRIGDIVKIGGSSGIVVAPTSITPSNNPTSVSSTEKKAYIIVKAPGELYASGYIIKSYDDKTPDDTTPPQVSSGDIVKMGGSGYLYATQQTSFSLLSNLPSSARTGTSASTSGISVTSGKHYLIVATQLGASGSEASESISGATVEWQTSVVNTSANNSRQAWTKVYLVTATSSTITVNIKSGNVGRAYVAIKLD